ncbi:OprD family outer membrane porin [Pseudomonas protegens]|uniref:OprD family outer membrane porin n=1 Tax=Pseudomonas protegens TaxID=380021 RepID=UPI002937482A|nr:OprD family outer membrane porin [Pseudomonas protegens]WOE81063.1 OprD family outer membrane porin [Pseudomonas protegens]
MHSTSNPCLPLSTLVGGCVLPLMCQAQFIDDSQLTLGARNFYMNRDFHGDRPPQNKAQEWAQGFVLRYQSGFTQGSVGLGVDGLGLLGIKLDSGGGTAHTGALLADRNGDVADQYGSFGLTAKARVASSVLSTGIHEPLLPVAFRNDTRLLPQTFKGTQLVSNDIQDLTLTLGRFDSVRQRNSTDHEDMQMVALARNGRQVAGGVASGRFTYSGASYSFSPELKAGYFHAELKDNYRQHYGNLTHMAALGQSLSLKSELRYFQSAGLGRAEVDNRNLGLMQTLSYRGHALSLIYQDQSGRSGMPFISGTDPFGFNTSTYKSFIHAGEDSWQVRYRYDFAAQGLPGLSLMSRYVRSNEFMLGQQQARERELDTDLAYVIQSGPLKDLGLRWRNVVYRAKHAANVDENRLILEYSLKLW